MDDNYSKSNNPNMSEDIRQISSAFLKAKEKFRLIEKKGKNSHMGNLYAKLEDIYNAIEEELNDVGIEICHFRGVQDGQCLLYTRLIHSISGQWMQDVAIIVSEKPGSQGHGSALTYAKRYALIGLCALGGDPRDDDDGVSEQEYIKKNAEKYPINKSQIEYLLSIMERIPENRRTLIAKQLSAKFNITKFSEICASDYDAVVELLNSY